MDDRSPVQKIIDLWHALPDFAEDAAIGVGAAKQMRRRGSVSSEYWVAIVAGATRRGINVSYEDLAKAHARAADVEPALEPEPAQ